MLCGMNVEDENLIVTGITDCVHQRNSVSVYVFLSVLKSGEVWLWDESCLVRLNHWFWAEESLLLLFFRVVGKTLLRIDKLYL